MIPYKHQEEISDIAVVLLRKFGWVYLAMEERTGKSLTAILICEKIKVTSILVITKKNALIGDEDLDIYTADSGWAGTCNKYSKSRPKNWDDNYGVWDLSSGKNITIVNIESINKVYNLQDYDIIIPDEAHANLSKFPKVGPRWLSVKKLCYKKPLIYCSATPSAQSYSQLYHQLKLSNWSPWKQYKNFYEWFAEYGIPSFSYGAGGRQIPKYNKTIPEAYDDVKFGFLTYTRKELGFEHEPNDILHFVPLKHETKDRYNRLKKDQVLDEFGEIYVADTPMKLMAGLHQLEGGSLKISDELSINLENNEKIDYILSEWGDTSDLVIFYHYKQEEHKLKEIFKKARVLQATSYAEGVDLSMYKTLVVYSMDFSTAKYSQRRARQCNMKRKEPINVHFLLVDKGISNQVYTTVAINKKNFINSYFDRGDL